VRDGIIRVILVDDHNVVRAGLKAVLGNAKDIEVVGEGSNGKDAISLADRLDPDVIVMDLSMGEMDGAEATKALVGKKARAKVLILTMHAEDSYLVPLLEAGASGYLVKSAADRELIDAVRAVAAETNVPLLEMNRLTMNLEEGHGAEGAAFRDRERNRLAIELARLGIGFDLFIPKVVAVFLQPISDRVNFFRFQFRDGGFNLLNRAHGENLRGIRQASNQTFSPRRLHKQTLN
jgi:DNA-binding NarL/FixJ family response regulator